MISIYHVVGSWMFRKRRNGYFEQRFKHSFPSIQSASEVKKKCLVYVTEEFNSEWEIQKKSACEIKGHRFPYPFVYKSQ